MSSPDDRDEQRDVLSSLPRSRRQRPSARREAARAKTKAAPATAAKAGGAKPRKTGTRAAASKPRPRKQAAPVAQARRNSPAKNSVIPPAGYATPREGSGRGSADPVRAVASLARGIRGLLPF